MRQNRFYLKGGIPDLSSAELADRVIINQIKNVLRLKVGETFFIFDGEGKELQVKIKYFLKEKIKVEVISQEVKEKSPVEVCLYLAILKKENFELAVQKAVESGASKIIPLITERTIKLGLKEERLNIIIKEAVEQSGQSFLPELASVINFSEALSQAKSLGDLNIFCDLDQESSKKFSQTSGRVNIFVGPEGGWSKAERELAKRAKLIFYSLGDSVLRAETGAIIATWLAVNKKL